MSQYVETFPLHNILNWTLPVFPYIVKYTHFVTNGTTDQILWTLVRNEICMDANPANKQHSMTVRINMKNLVNWTKNIVLVDFACKPSIIKKGQIQMIVDLKS